VRGAAAPPREARHQPHHRALQRRAKHGLQLARKRRHVAGVVLGRRRLRLRTRLRGSGVRARLRSSGSGRTLRAHRRRRSSVRVRAAGAAGVAQLRELRGQLLALCIRLQPERLGERLQLAPRKHHQVTPGQGGRGGHHG
jgi:hypothetical protein